MTALLILASLFYGVVFDPATTNAPSAARIFPVNATAYKMVQPDGVTRYLTADPKRPGVILGERPWMGMVRDNVIRVWADRTATGGKVRTSFTFVDGRLRILTLDGKHYEFPEGRPETVDSFASLWPPKQTRSYEKGSQADLWQRDKRLKLWYANPNSAGMLCAQVALVGLWLLLGGRWFRRVPGLALLLLAVYGVAQSGSRGALLGLAAGAGLMAVWHIRRHLNVRTVMMALGVVAVAIGLFAASGLTKRMAETVTHVDAGNRRRLTIGKAAVEMLADAPFGWHCGEVPGRHAALNWYVFDEVHVIRTHLLSMAELGWFAGFGYLFFWVLTVALGIAAAKRDEPLPGGVCLAFASAGLFNPVYTEASLWAVPAVATVWGVWRLRGRMDARSTVVCVAVAAGVAAAVVIVLALAGRALHADRRTCVCARGKAALVNGRAPSVWIVEDDKVLGGWGFPGREILAYYAQHPNAPAVGYVTDIRDLPNEVEKLVLPGRAAAEYLEARRTHPQDVCRAKKTVLLSPAVSPEKMDKALLGESKTIWIGGALAAARDDGYQAYRAKWLAMLPGVEQYVPNWLKLAFAW